MKQLSRRNLIRLLASASAILPASLVLGAPTGLAKPVEFTRALGPFLDTLLPDDETPGATRLGVDRAILERMGASGLHPEPLGSHRWRNLMITDASIFPSWGGAANRHL